MAYKFQLGAFVASGSIKAEDGVNANSAGVGAAGAIAGATSIDGSGDLTMGTITMTGFSVDADGDTALKSLAVDDSSTIGCDSDADIMTLAAQSLALANDVDFNIAKTAGLQLGGVAVSATAAQLNQLNSGEVTSVTEIFATDLKIGEDNQTKIDFEDANKINFYVNNVKEVVLEENELSPGTNDGISLGSAAKGWSDLYLADSGRIQLGNDQDVFITHVPDEGVAISTPGDGGAGPKAVLTLLYDSASPADNDMVGSLRFKGDDDGGNITGYAEITGVSKDVTDGTEDGALSFDVLINGSPVTLFDIAKTAASTVTIADGAYDFDIASHDGSNGLKLGGALVGASAAELNKLDGANVSTAELNKLAGSDSNSAADKMIILDSNGDFEMQDSDKIFFGNDADVSIHWDGSAMKIGTDNSGKAITIGHSTSEVTVADNLTIAGNLTVQGTTTTVDSTTINISSSFTFEGPADDHETILSCATPGADTTLNLPTLSAGTYFIPALADAATDASAAVTAAEFALLDGGSTVGTTALAAGDGFLHNDNGTMKQTQISKLGDFFASDGLKAVSGQLELDINSLGLSKTSLAQADIIGIVDSAASDVSKKITFSNFEDQIFGNVSGDIAIAAGGAATIQADAVESGMLNDNVISGQTELASGDAVDADEMLISDGGTLKKIGLDSLKVYMSDAAVPVANKDNGDTLAVGVNYFSNHGGAESVTLPASAGLSVGQSIKIKAGGDCSSTNTLTINKAGSQTIDGAALIVLESPFAAVELVYVAADTFRVF